MSRDVATVGSVRASADTAHLMVRVLADVAVKLGDGEPAQLLADSIRDDVAGKLHAAQRQGRAAQVRGGSGRRERGRDDGDGDEPCHRSTFLLCAPVR